MSSTQRVAVRFATYAGNVTEAIARDIADDRPFGPNLNGEQLWPVQSTYDPTTNKTRVGFSYIAPEVTS